MPFLNKPEIDLALIEPFKNSLIEVLNSTPEFQNDESKSISIQTLAEF